MFDEFGRPVVVFFRMSESGSLGGESGTDTGGAPGGSDPAGGSGGGVDTPADGAGGEGAGEGGEGSSPETKPVPSQRATEDWRDRRIATLTRRLKEIGERGQGTAAAPPPAPGPTGYSQADVDRLADQRARELSIIHDFNRRCDEVAMLGRQQFGEAVFSAQIANLQKLVDSADPQSVQVYNQFLMAALDTGEAPKLLHMLGSDLDEAQRIMALPPTRMAVELTKKAMTPGEQVSGAPRPIQPVGGRGASHEAISPDDPDRADHLGTGEWMRRREAQIAERERARRSR